MIRAGLVVVIAAGTVLACQPSSPATVASAGEGTKIPACNWPSTADTFDPASSTGCYPRSMFEICEVPSGSVVHADGTITTPDGETVSCDDACSPSEYSLSCYWPPGGQQVSPAPSLGCSPIPIPTPSNALFYCCPCTQ